MPKKKTKKKKSVKYITTAGGNYADIRFEKGDKKAPEEMPKDVLKTYLDMGVVVEVEDGNNR